MILDVLKYVRLLFTGKLTTVKMCFVTDEFAFAMGENGWNFYRDLVQESIDKEDVRLEETRFFRFFVSLDRCSPRFLDDVLFLHDPVRRTYDGYEGLYLGTWPWGGLTQFETEAGGTPFGWYYDKITGKDTRSLWGYGRNLWYQPGDRFTLEHEKSVTLRLLKGMKNGYHPWKHHSFPSVMLLVRNNGEQRALIVDGHHRLAILSILGYEETQVEVTQVVEEGQVDEWYYVKNGHCPRQRAIEIFYAFFEENGRERLEYVMNEASFGGAENAS